MVLACRYGMGGSSEHTCTPREEDQDSWKLEYANLGEKTCYDKESNGRKYYEGYNPFCGTKGLCCRYKQLKNGKGSECDPHNDNKGIGIEGKRYHHCVKP